MLQRESTADQLADAVATEILAGALVPGERLREHALTARYEVSRNTLREALHRLAREGLVDHRPHRGVAVARPTMDDAVELFRIRRLLEPAGLRAADASVAASLLVLAGAMEEAARAHEWGRLVDLDLQFHAGLVGAIGSSRLDAFFGGVLRELRLTFVRIDTGGGRVERASHVSDHRAIADRIAEGRHEDADQCLRAHLANAEELVLDHLRLLSGSGSGE